MPVAVSHEERQRRLSPSPGLVMKMRQSKLEISGGMTEHSLQG